MAERTPAPGARKILSWQQLIGILAGCGVLVFFLLPDDPRMLENLIHDGQAGEARRVLQRVTPEERAADPVRFAVAEQKLARLELGDRPSAAARDAFVSSSLARWRATDHAPEVLELLLADLGQARDVKALWSSLDETWASVPTEQREAWVKALVPLALAQEQPGVAATIFARLHGVSPTDEAAAVELARLERLAGRSAAALTALAEIPADRLQELRITLLRELNQNAAALAILSAELERLERAGEAPTKDQVGLIAAVARGAGRSEVALPWVRDYVEAHPDDLAGWRSLVVLQRETGAANAAAASQARVVRLSGRDPAELREWGRLLEGSGQPGAAYDVWMELGLRGDLAAVDRLIQLNPGLYRDRDLARVLERVVPVSGHTEYTLQLARLLTQVGRYDAAQASYVLYLETVPTDAAAMVELARLQGELYRYEEAAEWLQRAEALGSLDAGTRRKLSEAWVATGELDRALGVLRDLARETRELDDYGAYFRLARGLGAYDDFVEGLRGVIATDDATPSDYLTLAYGYSLLGRTQDSEGALREGLERFPGHADIVIRYAYTVSDARRYREAQAIIERHPQLRSGLEPARLYLVVMRLNNDLAAERAYLQSDLAPVVWDDAETRHLLARAYLALEDWVAAEALLEGLHRLMPNDWNVTGDLVLTLQRLGRAKEAQAMLTPLLATNQPEAWRMAAEVATALNEHGEAERCQLRYLDLVAPGTARDWGALGDIRLSRGDVTGAKRAYQRALREFQIGLLAQGGGSS